LSADRNHLIKVIGDVGKFLENNLKLILHPRKIEIRKFGQGIDFLGYVVLPHYKVLRSKTKRRIVKKLALKRKLLNLGKIGDVELRQAEQSYLGTLKHCHSQKIIKLLQTLD